jgi:hypothetical protein
MRLAASVARRLAAMRLQRVAVTRDGARQRAAQHCSKIITIQRHDRHRVSINGRATRMHAPGLENDRGRLRRPD